LLASNNLVWLFLEVQKTIELILLYCHPRFDMTLLFFQKIDQVLILPAATFIINTRQLNLNVAFN